MKNVSARVEHSLFEENGCNNSDISNNLKTIGGGMYINFQHNSDTFNSNRFTVVDVIFKNNCAQYGGGLRFSSCPKNHVDHSNLVEIHNCKFECNNAHIGSAVDITPNVFQRLSGGLLITPVFVSCKFLQNKVMKNINSAQMQATYGIGTVYVSLYSIVLKGNNLFCSNRGTAI